MGLWRGEVLLVHSSMSSLGFFVEGGYDAVIDAFLEVLGDTGTLLFPALSYATVTREFPVFSLKGTPCCIGKLPEAFRKRPGVIRSLHPTHSVCAVGRLAKEITMNHGMDTTPVGPNSPFRRLYEFGGRILMLGCGLRPNTFMHGVEEIAEVPYLLSPLPVEYECILPDGSKIKTTHLRHGFNGLIQRYDRVLNILEPGDFVEGYVGKAHCYLLDTKPLMEKSLLKLKDDPFYFVDPPKENQAIK
ncbi:MAG TPA: AAC(3) family N-acetyltransferase [Clostridiales bacterium]|nr:AAC(3) family N-acetyltransferase [Clostridiales bacterium]